jgi:hypothetical protein
MNTMVIGRTLRFTALAALAFGITAAATIRASSIEAAHTQYLTFSRAVALPGVTLNSGTYVFELADPDAAPDIVRVMSRDRRTVYFTAFTRIVTRASATPATEHVTLREVAPEEPMPIAVWWSDARTGRQFIYR